MDVSKATNILDQWIAAATRRLTSFVRVEMDAYRLYTVVPDLVRFIDSLTNIYVRYNRSRLKGRYGIEDCKFALASLFDVLLTVCKVRPWTLFQQPSAGRPILNCRQHASEVSTHLSMLMRLSKTWGTFQVSRHLWCHVPFDDVCSRWADTMQ